MTSILAQVMAERMEHYRCLPSCISCKNDERCEGYTDSYSAGTYRCHNRVAHNGLCRHHLKKCLREALVMKPVDDEDWDEYYDDEVGEPDFDWGCPPFSKQQAMYALEHEDKIRRLPGQDACVACREMSDRTASEEE
jgi:hypothetical protein